MPAHLDFGRLRARAIHAEISVWTTRNRQSGWSIGREVRIQRACIMQIVARCCSSCGCFPVACFIEQSCLLYVEVDSRGLPKLEHLDGQTRGEARSSYRASTCLSLEYLPNLVVGRS